MRDSEIGRKIREARKKKGMTQAELRPKMRPGKVYLYQMYTTCFAEFETVDQAKMFCQYADQNLRGWNVDPVVIIDTKDPESVKGWGNLMED